MLIKVTEISSTTGKKLNDLLINTDYIFDAYPGTTDDRINGVEPVKATCIRYNKYDDTAGFITVAQTLDEIVEMQKLK